MSDLKIALSEYIKAGGTQRSITNLVLDLFSEQPKFKVVIDTSGGNFLLNDFAAKQLEIKIEDACDVSRTDERLIALLEEHGTKAISEWPSFFEIVEVPIGTDWRLESDWNGSESIVW